MISFWTKIAGDGTKHSGLPLFQIFQIPDFFQIFARGSPGTFRGPMGDSFDPSRTIILRYDGTNPLFKQNVLTVRW